jgi:hypothetical protein
MSIEKFTCLVRTLALGLLVTAALALAPKATLAQRSGDLHVTKECLADAYTAGAYCTITSSNLAAIPVGARVYYDQAAGPPLGTGAPAGFVDSNTLLDAGTLDWAVGHCTVDYAAFTAIGAVVGLCIYSDGTGPLTGFQARVTVSWLGGVQYRWDGTYSFTPPGDLK